MNYLDDHKARLAEVQDDVDAIRNHKFRPGMTREDIHKAFAPPRFGNKTWTDAYLRTQAMHIVDGIPEGDVIEVMALKGYNLSAAQSRKMSAIESLTNSFTGFWISVVLAMWTVPWLYGAPAPLKQNIISTVLFTVVSIVRSYLVRRVFTWMHHVKGWN